jgi:hypothetical protein
MSNLVIYLRPSAAGTWTVCTGYVAMIAMYPDAPDEADNDVREDGTACHWLAKEVWEKRIPPVDSLSPNQRVLTEEMFDAVDEYHDEIRSWGCDQIHMEEPVDCGMIYPDMVGTPDVWGYNSTTHTLHLGDLKFGFRHVEVFKNLQFACYLIALITKLKLWGDPTLRIQATVFQPRSTRDGGAARHWYATLDQLRELFTLLCEHAAEAMQPGAPCTPNPGCIDCGARHACEAYQQAALIAVEQSFGSVPMELSPAAAGKELALLKRAQKHLEGRITGLEAQVAGTISQGKIVPGWELRHSYGRERWEPGKEENMIIAADLCGVDIRAPARPISPAQARKKLPTSLVAVYAHKPPIGLKLVKTDPLAAEKAFTNIKR